MKAKIQQHCHILILLINAGYIHSCCCTLDNNWVGGALCSGNGLLFLCQQDLSKARGQISMTFLGLVAFEQ